MIATSFETAAPPPTCPHSDRIDLQQALRRFEREAVWGSCDTGRYRCPYFVWGTGPPLVFVHGLSDQARSFALVISRLSERFRCIAYDLPQGQGDGARIGRLTHDDLVADLIALVDHMDVKQSYLLGSSFGSTIVLAALRAAPARFPRAILQGGFARRPLATAEILLARLLRHWQSPMSRLPGREAITRLVDGQTFAAQPAKLFRYFLDCTGANPTAAFAQRALLLHRVDLEPLLPEIEQPILLVCGDNDRLVGPSCEEVLLTGLSNAHRIELPDCGHYPHYTHPDLLAEVIRRFLTPAEQLEVTCDMSQQCPRP